MSRPFIFHKFKFGIVFALLFLALEIGLNSTLLASNPPPAKPGCSSLIYTAQEVLKVAEQSKVAGHSKGQTSGQQSYFDNHHELSFEDALYQQKKIQSGQKLKVYAYLVEKIPDLSERLAYLAQKLDLTTLKEIAVKEYGANPTLGQIMAAGKQQIQKTIENLEHFVIHAPLTKQEKEIIISVQRKLDHDYNSQTVDKLIKKHQNTILDLTKNNQISDLYLVTGGPQAVLANCVQ